MCDCKLMITSSNRNTASAKFRRIVKPSRNVTETTASMISRDLCSQPATTPYLELWVRSPLSIINPSGQPSPEANSTLYSIVSIYSSLAKKHTKKKHWQGNWTPGPSKSLILIIANVHHSAQELK